MGDVVDVFAQGETLAGGRYRIDGSLGRGGMAQVYKAYDLSLARPVAIKTMLPGLAVEPGLPERFRREAQAMAALAHPNVVTVHDTGEEPRPDGPPVPYFVMELVTGPSLADRIRTGGALRASVAVHVADQVLNALEASHKQELVHRDIKPSNVLLAEGGITKVADFGIVRVIAGTGTALTDTRASIGTPEYMSPEQARGLDLDGRSDLYAVGVLLFEMLTGRPLFEGPDGLAIAVRHVSDPPPTLASYGLPGLPGLEAVLARALAKRPEDRYRDAAQMRTALRAAGATPATAFVAAATVSAQVQPRAQGSFGPPPGPVPARPVQGPASVWVPPVHRAPVPPGLPMSLREHVRHCRRLGVCALLVAAAIWLLGKAYTHTLWPAYVGAGVFVLAALGTLPTWIKRSGPRLSLPYQAVSWILLVGSVFLVVVTLVIVRT
ncbi:protein kinase [Streptomyces sp. NPDC096339]|uniref:protein kinase domain-containing protein n=1 Tax=Streptomyces sp. NPDC096339 TaxID=3366086 RepID=UPI00382554BC